jgi:hypothetical protein
MLLAISNDGLVFFQFMSGTINQVSVQLFLLNLVRYLDRVKPLWRDTHKILMGKCPVIKRRRR